MNAMIKKRKPTKRICVVLVVDDLGYGGAERQVVELANNIDRNRFDIHICTLSYHQPLQNQLKNLENNLHIIERKIRFDFTVVPRLAYLLRTLKADIVHGYLFSAEIASRLAGRLAGTQVIIGTERSSNYSCKKRKILAYKLTRRCVDFIIANSQTGAHFNSRKYGFPVSNYRVVYNGVGTEQFRPMCGTTVRQKLGIPLKCPVVGSFSNFKKQKNHSMLFRAFKLVLESLPEARLLLVGDQPVGNRGRLSGYRARLDRLVDDLRIRHQSVFLGHQKDIEHLYPACDITVLPSLYEGVPNALLESMACGVPVITTDVSDNSYVVKEGETGFLVALGDEAKMARRMELLLGNSALRQEMGQKARHWVIEEFSCKRLAEKTEAIYMELLAERHK